MKKMKRKKVKFTPTSPSRYMRLKGGFEATTDPRIAMMHGYIGEVVLYATRIAFAVGLAVGVRHRAIRVFYYGTPDERLRKLFEYSASKKER